MKNEKAYPHSSFFIFYSSFRMIFHFAERQRSNSSFNYSSSSSYSFINCCCMSFGTSS